MITRHSPADRLARHRHAEPYVAVVLAGAYLEAGDDGRVRATAGTVIAHEPWTAHGDDFGAAGATVLNLPAVDGLRGAGRIADVDAVARAAERDRREAAFLLAGQFRAGADSPDDWPDQLAAAMTRNPDVAISGWADRMDLDPASVSRGFARVYGVTPKRFRLEARTRRAVRSLPAWRGSLAAFAADHGFADQAHLARAVRAITGASPCRWRAKSVQAGACRTG
jgi:AraC-like DNA-binding protein